VAELDRIRRHVAILDRPRPYAVPLLGALLQASLDSVHLSVVYDSRTGRTERVIFPFGLFSEAGFWYCACRDDARGDVSLRADRFVSIARLEGRSRPAYPPLATWRTERERDNGTGLALRVRVAVRGMTNFALQTLFAHIAPDGGGGGMIEETIPHGEIGWYAAQLLAIGTEVVVESPPELIAELCRQAEAITARYSPTSPPGAGQ